MADVAEQPKNLLQSFGVPVRACQWSFNGGKDQIFLIASFTAAGYAEASQFAEWTAAQERWTFRR